MDGLTLGSTVKDYGIILARSNSLNAIKMDFFSYKHSFSLHKMSVDCFLLAVWTLILTAPIHNPGSIVWLIDGVLNFSKSIPMKKQTYLHLGLSEGEYILSKF